jgi:hypothetical protein
MSKVSQKERVTPNRIVKLLPKLQALVSGAYTQKPGKTH